MGDLSLDYGQVAVDTTDPTKSNSDNMFSGLLANSLNGGSVVTERSVDQVLPELKQILQDWVIWKHPRQTCFNVSFDRIWF